MRSHPIRDTDLTVEAPEDWGEVDGGPIGCDLVPREDVSDGSFATNLTVVVTSDRADPEEQIAALEAGLEGFHLLDRAGTDGG